MSSSRKKRDRIGTAVPSSLPRAKKRLRAPTPDYYSLSLSLASLEGKREGKRDRDSRWSPSKNLSLLFGGSNRLSCLSFLFLKGRRKGKEARTLSAVSRSLSSRDPPPSLFSSFVPSLPSFQEGGKKGQGRQAGSGGGGQWLADRPRTDVVSCLFCPPASNEPPPLAISTLSLASKG